MTIRAGIFLAMLGVIALVASVEIPNIHAASRLPPDLIQRLTKLRGDLIAEAKNAQADIDKLERYESGFRVLQGVVPSQQAPIGARFYSLATDGLEIGRKILLANTLLQQDAIKILANVAGGLVNGEAYLALDNLILSLEKSESQIDSQIGQLGAHLDQVDAMFGLAAKADAGSLKDAIETGRSALLSLKLTDRENDTRYNQLIKPGTRSLRFLVDQLPKL